MTGTTPLGAALSVEARVLDAAKACVERWGMAKLTIDDIANAAGVSRATLYRMFPGGKDVLFEALRMVMSGGIFVPTMTMGGEPAAKPEVKEEFNCDDAAVCPLRRSDASFYG